MTDVNTLQSPDGKLEMTFQLTEAGTPQYALTYEGKDIILPSNLGFEMRGVLKAQQLVYNADGTISSQFAISYFSESIPGDQLTLKGYEKTSIGTLFADLM